MSAPHRLDIFKHGHRAVEGGRGRGWGRGSAQHHQGDGPTSSLGPVPMGKEQRTVCGGGLVVEVAVLSKLGLNPSGVEEADSGRVCETTGVGVGVTASVLAQSSVQGVLIL